MSGNNLPRIKLIRGKLFPDSFKSKKYRDKLRTEVKSLENLLPIDRPALHRKLDSQTVYRLVIAFLRIKALFKELTDKTSMTSESKEKDNVIEAKEPVKSNSTATENETAEDFFKGPEMFEIMDGFILVASVDGTILYVSDNVIHFTGFHQVDLMHRCIYGLVHPDEQCYLKEVIENEQNLTSWRKQPLKANNDKILESEAVRISFLCRMKSFSGNVGGYTKMYCIGKVACLPDMPRSPKTSDRILLLYCQPFIPPSNDVSQGGKTNIFWTKHDLDLKFSEIEETAKQTVAYDTDDLRGTSFYTLVHPEDLYTCATVHKALTETTEVQTMYFRFQKKDGRWIWLQSKGKLICKNSKKFSIVFTHCPIREEENTFIRQETLLRRRHALNDLICMRLYNVTSSYSILQTDKGIHQKVHTHDNIQPPLGGFTDDSINNEADFVLHNDLSQCPSSWHSNSDRHSPILPSSHVSHKITQKDKQRQFSEYKRKLNSKRKYNWNESRLSHSLAEFDYDYSHFHDIAGTNKPVIRPYYYHQYRQNNDFIPSLVSYSAKQYAYNAQFQSYPDNYDGESYQKHYLNYVTEPMNNGYSSAQNQCRFPPSPPISPDDFQARKRIFHKGLCQTNDILKAENILPKSHIKEEHFPNSSEQRERVSCIRTYAPPNTLPSPIHSLANIRMSMFCTNGQRTDTAGYLQEQVVHQMQQFIQNVSQYPGTEFLPEHFMNRSANPGKAFAQVRESCPDSDIAKQYQNQDSSRVLENGCCSNKVVKYDIEASIHMKIVEAEKTSTELKQDINLPAVGSFLEYLNEN